MAVFRYDLMMTDKNILSPFLNKKDACRALMILDKSAIFLTSIKSSSGYPKYIKQHLMTSHVNRQKLEGLLRHTKFSFVHQG